MPRQSQIVNAFRGAFEDPVYARTVTVSTGDPVAVESRLTLTKKILVSALA